jgi:ABC-type transport system substrate-binding protein
MLRRIGAVTAASVAISTLAAGTSQAATPQTASPYGGTAKVAIFDTFSGWCFGNNLANSALMAARTVYESLFEKTADGKLVPLLAESATPVAGTGQRVWDLVLRKGIKFHDGTDFDADAVKLNFDYITATKHFGELGAEIQRIGTPGQTTTAKQKTAYANALADNLKKGDNQATAAAKAGLSMASAATSVSSLAYSLSTGTAFAANVLTIIKSGTHSLKFVLQRGQSDFPGTLFASGRFFMRAPSQFDADAGGGDRVCATMPVGTGPFKLKNSSAWSTNKLTVIRNDNYWRSDAAGNKLPYLDSIVFDNIKEAPQRAAAMRTGAYDAGMFSSAGEGANIKSLRTSKVKELKSGTEYYPSLWLNQGKPGSPFANADARAAVAKCIDRVAFFKVRQNSEGAVAKSLVGPKSEMYSTKGFQKFSVRAAKKHVAAYKKATGKKTLTFTLPADVSAASKANVNFLKQTWAKCGITARVKVEESAVIIAKAFNASPDTLAREHFNAYDAISITLFEGTDVSFNLPFVLSNAYSQGTSGAKYGDTLVKLGLATQATADGLATKAQVYGASLGTVLGLNHHTNTAVDQCFFDEQASTGTKDYSKCTALLQSNNVMTSGTHFYYTMFFSKKGKLSNYGKLARPDGEASRKMSNYGIEWTAVKKGK